MTASKFNVQQSVASLSHNPWFNALPLPDQKLLVSCGEPVVLQGGEMLYRKGDSGTGFYGVLTGALKISTLGEDGREGILAIMESGNWLGETSLLDGQPRPHDVTALQKSTVLQIAPADFHRLMQRSAFALAMSTLLCSRVRALYGLVEDSMLRSTRARIARRLVSLARGDTSQHSDARASLHVSHESLAMMLGITRQTLAKELKVLAQAKVISLGYGRIDIQSLADLERHGAAGEKS
jgi:CRP/FNR family transcriptional regulator, cyclic AMP receptor protein